MNNESSKIIVLRLSKDEVRRLAEPIKALFAKYPGEYVVYVEVDGKRIRANAKVAWGEELRGELERLIQTENITIKE